MTCTTRRSASSASGASVAASPGGRRVSTCECSTPTSRRCLPTRKRSWAPPAWTCPGCWPSRTSSRSTCRSRKRRNTCISTPQLNQMKQSAILINTSRGPVVDEAALVEALKTHRIAGAGLDVFEREPAVHPGLVALHNVVLAPHIASATTRTRSEMSAIAARNMATAVRGGRPPNAAEPGSSAIAHVYRLLALDLDGTILDAHLQLDPRDVTALERIKARRHHCHRLPPAGRFRARCHGRRSLAWTVRSSATRAPRSGRSTARSCSTTASRTTLAMEVIRYARERNLHVQAYRDDQLIVERDRPEAHRYSEHAGMPIHLVPDLDSAMGPTTPKLVIVADPAVLEKLLPRSARPLEGQAQRGHLDARLPRVHELQQRQGGGAEIPGRSARRAEGADRRGR